MISITDLPTDTTASDILDSIAGGAVMSLSLAKSALAGMPTTAHVTFFHHTSAANFTKHYQYQPLKIQGQEVKVTHVLFPIIPAVIDRVRKEFCTRCLTISEFPSTWTADDIRKELLILDQYIGVHIEIIHLKDDGSMYLSFLNVENAIRVKEYLNQSIKHKDYCVQFAHDPCARRIQQVPYMQNLGQTPQPQLNALAPGSYMRQPQISQASTRPLTSFRAPGYQSYKDLDVTVRTNQVTSLEYDDDVVDSGIETTEIMPDKVRAGPATYCDEKSLLDTDCPFGDETINNEGLSEQDTDPTNTVNGTAAADLSRVGLQGGVDDSEGIKTLAESSGVECHRGGNTVNMLMPEGLAKEMDKAEHSSSVEQTQSSSFNDLFPSFTTDEPKGEEAPPVNAFTPERKDTLFDDSAEDLEARSSKLGHNTSPPADRHIPPGIVELAEALLSVSESPSIAPGQAERPQSTGSSDHGSNLKAAPRLPLHSSSSSSTDASPSSISEHQHSQRSASPSPSSRLPPCLSLPPSVPKAPRAMLLHDYSNSTSVREPMSSTGSTIQQNHGLPNPPNFGFTFTPFKKSIHSSPSASRVGEAGLNLRGRKVVRYDDLYETLPNATTDATTVVHVADSIKDGRPKFEDVSEDAKDSPAQKENVVKPEAHHEQTIDELKYEATEKQELNVQDAAAVIRPSTTPNLDARPARSPAVSASGSRAPCVALLPPTNTMSTHIRTTIIAAKDMKTLENDPNYDGGDEEEEGEAVSSKPSALHQPQPEIEYLGSDEGSSTAVTILLNKAREDRDATISRGEVVGGRDMWLDY